MFLQFVVGPGFQLLEDFCVGSPHLSVAARMSNGGEAQLDAHVVAVVPKKFAGEQDSIISDDPIWNTKPCHQILDEFERRVLVGLHDYSLPLATS